MNWHQMNAARRAYRTRNMPAHIFDPNNPARTLCGATHPDVWLEPAYKKARENPANKVCKSCAKVAEEMDYDQFMIDRMEEEAQKYRRRKEFGMVEHILQNIKKAKCLIS